MTYVETYRSSARTTTAVTVVPSRLAFATASRHRSGGMRSERGMVATSAPLGEVSGELGRPVLGVGGLGLPPAGAPDGAEATTTRGNFAAWLLLVTGRFGRVHVGLLRRRVSTVNTMPYLHVKSNREGVST